MVDYTTAGNAFLPGKPRVWPETRIFQPAGGFNFDLHPDGKRIAMLRPPAAEVGTGSIHVEFLLNFFDEVRRHAPPAR